MGTFLKQLGRLLIGALIDKIVEGREIGSSTAKKVAQHVVSLYKSVRKVDPLLEQISEAVDSDQQTFTLSLNREQMEAFAAIHSDAESVAVRVGGYLDKVKS
jgi:50S ribosomal subunit-associated GTPase HflX